MKKIILTLTATVSLLIVSAQNIGQGYQQLYYERYQSAANTFNTILQQQPNNAEALYGLVKAAILQDDIDKAASVLYNASSLSTQPYYQVAYGYLLLKENKKDSARIYFDNAIRSTKEKDAGILTAVGAANIEAKNGDASYAVEVLQKAVQRDDKNAALYTLLGDAYRKSTRGDASEAYQMYQRAIQLNPNYAAAYYALGTIFLSQKNNSFFIDNLTKAVNADAAYAPAYYSLYTYYFNIDPQMAMSYFNKYSENADNDARKEYAKIDLLYLNKQYNEAINAAQKVLQRDGEKAKPRLYKLMAYSYAEQKDSATALAKMQQYFAHETDSNFIGKDFETMSELFTAKNNTDSAAFYLEKGVSFEKDSSKLFPLYKSLATFYKTKEDYSKDAYYMGKYYVNNPKATNLDLFNWGLEHYRAKEYDKADSVFGLYVAAYPEQGYGYYWQARSKALLDTAMTQGIAVPVYQKLVEVIGDKVNEGTNKKWLIDAYNYLAAYRTNAEKDYEAAIEYFEKVLELDPGNADASKYISMLKKNIAQQEKASGGSK